MFGVMEPSQLEIGHLTLSAATPFQMETLSSRLAGILFIQALGSVILSRLSASRSSALAQDATAFHAPLTPRSMG